jgi:hypothetical protein
MYSQIPVARWALLLVKAHPLQKLKVIFWYDSNIGKGFLQTYSIESWMIPLLLKLFSGNLQIHYPW